jgi:hypothetical protein
LSVHLLHDTGLVCACSQKGEDGFHTIFIVRINYLILLKWTKLKCFFTKISLEIFIVFVQLPELTLNNLDVLWVVKVDVYIFFFIISLTLTISVSALAPLIVFIVIFVVNDLCESCYTTSFFVCLDD